MKLKPTTYFLSRLAIGFIWLYHGLVPKLIFRSQTELELIEKGPMVFAPETTLLIAGIAEVILGLCVLGFWKLKWPAYLSLIGFSFLLVAALVMSPAHATHAFNPVTLTVSAILFCLINLNEASLQEVR